MQTGAEQRSHLLRGNRVAGGEAVDPIQARADPDAWRLTPFGVIRRQTGMTLLGCVQGRDLPGQVVIPRPGCELVKAHRHTHPKGVHAAGRSRRPGRLPPVHGVYPTSNSENEVGVRLAGGVSGLSAGRRF